MYRVCEETGVLGGNALVRVGDNITILYVSQPCRSREKRVRSRYAM